MRKFIKLPALLAVILILFITGCGKNVGTPISPENLKKWGLGKKETRYVCNDRDYEWYIDQYNTGTYSRMNCGPTCCVMAAKWYNKDFSETAEQAREYFVLDGNGWTSKEMAAYLRQSGIPAAFEKSADISKMEKDINKGRILIVPLNMEYISADFSSEKRVSKYGITVSNHYIIIKGYRVVDGNTYFEVYDPASMDRYFSDGSPIGKGRYYLADEVITAIKNFQDYFIAICTPDEQSGISEQNNTPGSD